MTSAAAAVQRRATEPPPILQHHKEFLDNPDPNINKGQELVTFPDPVLPEYQNQVKMKLALLRVDNAVALAESVYKATKFNEYQKNAFAKAAIILGRHYFDESDHATALQYFEEVDPNANLDHLWSGIYYHYYAECRSTNRNQPNADWNAICRDYRNAIHHLEKLDGDETMLRLSRTMCIKAAIRTNNWIVAAEQLEKTTPEERISFHRQMRLSRFPIEILQRGFQFYHLPWKTQVAIGVGMASLAIINVARRSFG